MGRHGGLWFYWPRSDKVSVATTCSLQWRESSGILRQACLDVGMFSSVYHTASARPASWGALTDLQQEPTMTAMYFWAFMYCLICFSPPHGIELLMRDDWQAGGGGGISFQRFTVTRSGLASPLPPQTLLLFGSTQGNYSLCLAFCMLPGRWSCLSACLKCAGIGCTLWKTPTIIVLVKCNNIHQNTELHPRWQTQSRTAAFQVSTGFPPGHKEHVNRYSIEWFSVTSRWWTKVAAVSWKAPPPPSVQSCGLWSCETGGDIVLDPYLH